MTLVWYMRDADIQDDASSRQLTMQGWTRDVWTADINSRVSAGRKCEVGYGLVGGGQYTERSRGLRPEPRGIPTFKPETRGRAQEKSLRKS